MLISQRISYRNEKTKEIVTWIFLEAIIGGEPLKGVVKTSEGEDEKGPFFRLAVTESLEYHTWMVEIFPKEPGWKEIRVGDPIMRIPEIPLPKLETDLVKTRRDLLDFAAKTLPNAHGIPSRFLEEDHGR